MDTDSHQVRASVATLQMNLGAELHKLGLVLAVIVIIVLLLSRGLGG